MSPLCLSAAKVTVTMTLTLTRFLNISTDAIGVITLSRRNTIQKVHLSKLFPRKMFVVVYLLKPGVRIIIPENFVHDLCEQTLKNIGRNSNHKYLIYWSKNVNGDGICQPNFGAPLSDHYPPQNDAIEACYIAQLKYFFRKYKNYYRDNFLFSNITANFFSFS